MLTTLFRQSDRRDWYEVVLVAALILRAAVGWIR